MRSSILVSSLTSSSSSFSSFNTFFRTPQVCPLKHCPTRAFSIKTSSNSSSQSPQDHLRIGNPEPPWLVLPPVAPKSPFSDEAPSLFDFQVKRPSVGIPFSLRLVQLMKKKMRSRRSTQLLQTPSELDSIGSAVWSLASVVEELQRSVLSIQDDEIQISALEDTSESIVWLFNKVFYASPNLVVSVLVLMAKFLATSTRREIPKLIINVLESKAESSPYLPPKCWSDIGVLHDEKEETRTDPEYQDYTRRRLAYEQMIISGNINSLILSNYAQLLYQYENDLDRANDYFNWAVMAEPVDAEAMSRYASFLWHGRGDLGGAEEMLLEAIQADPENSHHRSSYAWFLWKTGGLETCYPLGDGDEQCEENL